MTEEQRNGISYDEKIDLIEVARYIWSKRVFVARVIAVFTLIGLIVAITSKVEYTSACKLLPETQEGNMGSLGSLGGLAGLAGINLGSMSGSSGSLSPSLYPEIVRSVPFMLSLVNEPVKFEKLDTVVTPYLYFEHFDSPGLLGLIGEYTVGLPGKIKKIIGDKNLQIPASADLEYIRLSKNQLRVIEEAKDRITIETDSETGVILVEVCMPDPYAAAVITNKVVEKLTFEVINYKIEKVKTNLDFVHERLEEAKNKYDTKQKALAVYIDRNKNVRSSLVQTEQKYLENEASIAFEVYKGLASQLEQAKIKVKEETPVFTILEPVDIPVNKSKPKRSLIVIGFVFMGGILGIFWVLIKRAVA